jgi:flagellar hook-basal body complex protein FliE
MISIDKLPALPQITQGLTGQAKQNPVAEKGGSFADTLKTFVSDVNEIQQVAADKDLKFATGEIKDVHEVMAAAEEAGLSLQLLLELRNKALDAYRELIRIPV